MSDFDNKIVIEVPIYSIEYMNDKLLVAGAGGGQKFGVRNYFRTYKIKNGKISKTSCGEVEYPTEMPFYIKAFPKSNTCIVCLSDTLIYYSVNVNSGEITELNKTKVIENCGEENYLTILSLNDLLNQAAVGTNNGLLK